MVDYEKMSPAARRARDFYAIKPDAGIIQHMGGYDCLDSWEKQGHLEAKDLDYLRELFMYEELAWLFLGDLGQCEAKFYPYFTEEVLEDRFYDDPVLVHDCMKTWFELADKVISEKQKYITIDEILFFEDICYKGRTLISPDMIREFLLPYYQQLIANLKSRQIDKSRHLFVEIDTDGFCYPVIEIYKEIGADHISPFEAAAGCDVVEAGKKYPELKIHGGFDKRILAAGKNAIDREIERIMPVMKRRGGYIPMCDHVVPDEVKFDDYMHYRKRMQEFKN